MLEGYSGIDLEFCQDEGEIEVNLESDGLHQNANPNSEDFRSLIKRSEKKTVK